MSNLKQLKSYKDRPWCQYPNKKNKDELLQYQAKCIYICKIRFYVLNYKQFHESLQSQAETLNTNQTMIKQIEIHTM